MRTARLRADFTHGFRTQPHEWARDYAIGNVPEESPYGMHQIRDHGIDLVMRKKPVGLRRVVNRLGYRVDRLHWGDAAAPVQRARADVSIAWDERTGIPISLARSTTSRVPLLSGCIWLTDQERPRDYHVRALRRLDAVYVNSTAQVARLRELGVADDRIHYFPMGIAANFYRPQETVTDGPDQNSGVFCVGHDIHRDYETLMRSVGAVQGRPGLASVRLTLVTKDPVSVPEDIGVLIPHEPAWRLRQHYWETGVVAIALKPNVHVSGVTASLEAMACGRPVVVTGNPGMEQYIRHGETGLLVPPGDHEAMADAIEMLLRDPERRREMGLAGRRSVIEQFTTEKLSGNLAAVVHRVVTRAS
jgi:hypothetical protein